MKSKTKSKTSNHKPSSHPGHQPSQTTHPTHTPEASSHANLRSDTCQEIETRGFSSFDESLEAVNGCTSPATQYCSNCNKSVCNTHYDSHHRSHDNLNQRQGHNIFHQ